MSSTRVLLRLTGYAWRHKWHLGAAYAAMMVATLSAVVIPRLLGNAIDEALTDGGRGQLILLAGAILVISVIRGIFSYGQSYLSEGISQRAAYDLRNDIFRKLQSLSFGYHDRQQAGNLMSRATQDVEAVRWFMSMGLVRGLSIVVMLGAVGALMVSTNWRLGIISMAFAPLGHVARDLDGRQASTNLDARAGGNRPHDHGAAREPDGDARGQGVRRQSA